MKAGMEAIYRFSADDSVDVANHDGCEPPCTVGLHMRQFFDRFVPVPLDGSAGAIHCIACGDRGLVCKAAVVVEGRQLLLDAAKPRLQSISFYCDCITLGCHRVALVEWPPHQRDAPMELEGDHAWTPATQWGREPSLWLVGREVGVNSNRDGGGRCQWWATPRFKRPAGSETRLRMEPRFQQRSPGRALPRYADQSGGGEPRLRPFQRLLRLAGAAGRERLTGGDQILPRRVVLIGRGR